MTFYHELVLAWLAVTSLLAFVLFAWDKAQARKAKGGRISEFHLALLGALGGWTGGLAAMLVFRHKTAKFSFQLKYSLAFVVWAALVYWAWGRG